MMKLACIWFAVAACVSNACAATLQLQITPKMLGQDLQPASLRYQTSAGETFSVTRVSYFVSDVELQRDDGSWLAFSNAVGWLDFNENRDSIRIEQVPPE